MTSVKFLADRSGIYGFEISGHSTENCEDIEGKIVCSAISSAGFMAANTIMEIVGDKCETEVTDGFMSIKVVNPCDKSRAVIEGLRLHITELGVQYRNRIKIITEV